MARTLSDAPPDIAAAIGSRRAILKEPLAGQLACRAGNLRQQLSKAGVDVGAAGGLAVRVARPHPVAAVADALLTCLGNDAPAISVVSSPGIGHDCDAAVVISGVCAGLPTAGRPSTD